MPSPVINFTNTPPGSPANGDRYVCGTSPTGAWSGQANKYATYLTSAWEFRAPIEGELVYDQTGDAHRLYDGSAWNLFTVQINSTKDSVRVASTANVTISSPGSTIDGVTMASGDRVLLKDQSTGSQNGIYVWNGAASAMTRATDFDTSAEVQPNVVIGVQEGTANADKRFQLTTNAPITLATTALTFAEFGASGTTTVSARKNSAGSVFTRGRLNLIEGSNITLTVADDGTDNEIDVTIAASTGGGTGNEYSPFATLVSPSGSNQALTSSGGTALSIRGGDTESFGATGYSITTTTNGSTSSLRGRYYTMTLPDGGFVCVSLNRPTCGSFSNAVFALMHAHASGASSGFSAFVFNQDNNVLMEGYTSSTTNTGPVGTARAVIVPSGYPRVWLGWERQGLDYLPWWSYDGVSWTPYGNKATLGSAADGIFVGTNSYSATVVAVWKSIRVFAAIGPAGGV